MSVPGHHQPVLLDEVVRALDPTSGKTYVDGTFGRGGYAKAIMSACADCKVIGIDCDPEAVKVGSELAGKHPNRFQIVEARFSEIDRVTESLGIDEVHGITLDVGVSSVQLDDPDRGFSFQKDAPLDMRMSKAGVSAADVVNDATEQQLSDIIYQYGEERNARRVAKEIVRSRSTKPIATTIELSSLIERVVGRSRSRSRIHPATKTFQALRIYVNDEIHELAYGLVAAERVLHEGACLAVVTFHSLEDRLVKRFLAIRSGRGRAVSRHQPPHAESCEPTFRVKARRVIKPSDAEVASNPRARSAKLRTAYRTGSAPIGLDLGELGLRGLPTWRAA